MQFPVLYCLQASYLLHPALVNPSHHPALLQTERFCLHARFLPTHNLTFSGRRKDPSEPSHCAKTLPLFLLPVPWKWEEGTTIPFYATWIEPSWTWMEEGGRDVLYTTNLPVPSLT